MIIPLMLYNMTMKKKLIYFTMSLTYSLALLAGPVIVRAESGSGLNSGSGRSSATTATTSTSGSTATADPEKEAENEAELETEKSITEANTNKVARDARIGDYKKLLKETMTTALKARISSRCVPAQALVKAKSTKNNRATKIRTEAYDEIVTELEKVVTAAGAKDADITALQASITTLKANIATFKTANTAYQQALIDVAVVDCTTDPTAFKAALEVARTNQIAVFNAAKAIRTHLTATVKPALALVKTDLSSTEDK